MSTVYSECFERNFFSFIFKLYNKKIIIIKKRFIYYYYYYVWATTQHSTWEHEEHFCANIRILFSLTVCLFVVVCARSTSASVCWLSASKHKAFLTFVWKGPPNTIVHWNKIELATTAFCTTKNCTFRFFSSLYEKKKWFMQTAETHKYTCTK